jgi:hypothetical protein
MLRNNYYSIITIALVVFGSHFGAAQTTPTLVKNLNAEAHSSSPRDFYSVNNQLYFTADDEEGEKIFRTDGSEDGTIPITYTPPAGMVFRKATVLNGQWYVLLLETPNTSTEHAQKVVLARTDFASTNIIQTLSTCRYPIFKDFSAKNGKLVIQYSYLTSNFGTARSQSFFVHNGNSNGILMSKEATATTTYATFANDNTFFVEETYKANGQENYKALFALNNGVATSVYKESWAANAPTPFDLFTTVGVATDKIHVSIKDALVNFTTTGVRTPLKTGVDVVLYAKTAGETMYFVNNRRELWKTDGSVANTTLLNAVFESPNEVIINLLGGGTSAYVVTQGGNTTRTYYIKPQGGLTKVNTGEGVTYFQPFVSKGLQYTLANKATAVPTCSIPSLIRYGQTAAQTQSFDLGDPTVELCDNSMTSPTYSLLMDNNLFYYGMQTLVYGNELWKLQLAPAIGGNPNPTPTSNTWCDSKSNMPWELYISNVNVGTLQNASGKFKEISTLGYSNFTNLSATLVKGQNYPLSVTPMLSWIGNLPNVYCNVWIDFNKNNVFETNELVLGKGNQNPFTQTFAVPADAVLGSTRMRVSLKYGGAPTACDAFEKGEVEDYTIQITEVAQSPLSSGKVKSNDWGIEIYPNPAADKAIIDLKNFADKHITLAISDLAGKILLTQTIENVNVTSYALPIQTLESGTYFVTVQAIGERSVTSQLQIVK